MLVHPTGKFDNRPANNKHIDVHPLAAAMGAEIRGVNLARLTDEQFAEIRAALFRHKMIYFRGQTIAHGDQESFSGRFGRFAEDAYTKGVPGHPDVQPLIKEKDQKIGLLFGAGWHTDSAFLPEPPAISMLYSVEVPPYGGDTIWANGAPNQISLWPGSRSTGLPVSRLPAKPIELPQPAPPDSLRGLA